MQSLYSNAKEKQNGHFNRLAIINSNNPRNDFSSVIKWYKDDINEMADFWWLRAANSNGNFDFLFVASYGNWNNSSAGRDFGFAPAFRIG